MAILYGVNATKRDVTVPSVKLKVNENIGRRRVMYDEITLVAELGVADIVKFMKIPSGAKLYNAKMFVDGACGGGATDFDLGWAANSVESISQDGIINTMTFVAAKIEAMTDTAGKAGYVKEFGAETQLQLHAVTATTTGTGKKISVEIEYSLD